MGTFWNEISYTACKWSSLNAPRTKNLVFFTFKVILNVLISRKSFCTICALTNYRDYRLVAPLIPVTQPPILLAALTSSTSTDGTTTSTTPSTTTTKSTEKPPSRLPPLITPLAPFSNDVSPIVGFSLVRAENSSLHGKRGKCPFPEKFSIFFFGGGAFDD